MDAIRTREWKMMFLLNRLSDNTGNTVFTALHFFLFMIIFYIMDQYFIFLFITVSVLLIIHQIMHIIFSKHTENRMNNIFSRVIISTMFINSCVSLAVYYLFY